MPTPGPILVILLLLLALLPLLLLRTETSRHRELERYKPLIDAAPARIARGQPPIPEPTTPRHRRQER